MSRSRKKAPVTGFTTCRSEKADKRAWHRAFRRAARQSEDAGEHLRQREFSDPWVMGKDGKCWWGNGRPELLRK